MPATPRPALLPLLSLLLLHVPHAARAQVNPGKPHRDQVAAGAIIAFSWSLLLPDGQVQTHIISIISGTFSALGAVCDGPLSPDLPGHSAVLHLTWAPAVTCRAPLHAPGNQQGAGHGKFGTRARALCSQWGPGHGGSLGLEAARCQAIVFSAGLCLLWWFCSKPRLALGKWLDWVPGCAQKPQHCVAGSTGMFRWLFLQASAPSCAGMDRAQLFPGFPQGVPLTEPFKGFFHLWEE